MKESRLEMSTDWRILNVQERSGAIGVGSRLDSTGNTHAYTRERQRLQQKTGRLRKLQKNEEVVTQNPEGRWFKIIGSAKPGPQIVCMCLCMLKVKCSGPGLVRS